MHHLPTCVCDNMLSKREGADSKEEAQSSDRLLYQKQSILSVCYLGCEDPPGRPSFSELKSRLRRAYDTEEAAELLSFVEARESDTAAFWSELDSVDMDRAAAPPLDADVSKHIRLLARLETERHMAARMLLREKKQLQRKKRGQGPAEVFDANGSAEKALELVEALPQGSRGTQATHEGLFKLGREVAGRDAPPERQVEFGKWSACAAGEGYFFKLCATNGVCVFK